MAKIDMYFKKDLSRPLFVPHYFVNTNDQLRIYDIVLEHTDSHVMASEVSGWAPMAGIDEKYDTDDICATIVFN